MMINFLPKRPKPEMKPDVFGDAAITTMLILFSLVAIVFFIFMFKMIDLASETHNLQREILNQLMEVRTL